MVDRTVAAGQEASFAGCWLVKRAQAGMVHAWADAPQIQVDAGAASYAKPLPDGWHLLPYRARQAIPVLTTLDGGSIYPQLEGYEGTHPPASMAVRFLGMARRPTFLADTLLG